MENAADALKMAGAVLMFIMALSVSIVSFGRVRQASDIILDYKDRESSYLYYNKQEDDRVLARQVGLETIIPAMYRAYEENYRIVFLNSAGQEIKLYGTTTSTEENVERYVLDTMYQIDFGIYSSKDVITYLLYGANNNLPIAEFNKLKQKIKLSNPSGLIAQLGLDNKKIEETLGVYYEERSSNTPEANLVKKRVITYQIK